MLGLGNKEAQYLEAILKSSEDVVSVKEAAEALDFSQPKTSRIMARIAKKGWLKHLKNGYYQPMSVASREIPMGSGNPFVVASAIFKPCYVAGWSALNYWGLTDQLFDEVCIITGKKFKANKATYDDYRFYLKYLDEEKFFGLEKVWIDGNSVYISDPSKTILDILRTPKLGLGWRQTLLGISQFLKDKNLNARLESLLIYASELSSDIVYKRLGFYLDTCLRLNEALKSNTQIQETINQCLDKKNSNIGRLDTGYKAGVENRKWSLLVPTNIEEGINL